MMRKRNIIRTLFLLLAVTATFLAFSTILDKPVAADSACKESLESCPKQQNGGKMIWENITHQFFSTI
jgi:hypothetical protein